MVLVSCRVRTVFINLHKKEVEGLQCLLLLSPIPDVPYIIVSYY